MAWYHPHNVIHHYTSKVHHMVTKRHIRHPCTFMGYNLIHNVTINIIDNVVGNVIVTPQSRELAIGRTVA